MFNYKVTLVCFATLITALNAFVLSENQHETPASSSSSESFIDDLLDDMRLRLHRSCQENSKSNETFERLIEVASVAPLCLENKLDAFVGDVTSLSESNRVEFFDKYCPILIDSLTCLDALVAELRKCLDHDNKNLLDIVHNRLLPQGLNIACKDHGEIFFLGLEAEDKCFANIGDEETGCFVNVSNATTTLELRNFGLSQCAELIDIRKCIQSHLNNCKLNRLMELVDLFYQPLLEQSPCAKVSQCLLLIDQN